MLLFVSVGCLQIPNILDIALVFGNIKIEREFNLHNLFEVI